jgi:hypothetical protein
VTTKSDLRSCRGSGEWVALGRGWHLRLRVSTRPIVRNTALTTYLRRSSLKQSPYLVMNIRMN